MEKPLLTAVSWVGQNLRGSPRAGQTVLASLMKSHICHPPASSVSLWGRVQKRDNDFCSPFSLGESSPLALTLMPDTSVPRCMPLVPFNLLSRCLSSEEVRLNKSMSGFLKRNCLGLKKFLLLTQLLLVFAARSYGDLSS